MTDQEKPTQAPQESAAIAESQESINAREIEQLNEIAEKSMLAHAEMGRLSRAVSVGMDKKMTTIDDLLRRVIEIEDHARSALPGSATPVDTAMQMITKVCDLAKKIRGVALPDLIAEVGSLGQTMNLALNAVQQTQIQTMMATDISRTALARSAGGGAFETVVNQVNQNTMSIEALKPSAPQPDSPKDPGTPTVPPSPIARTDEELLKLYDERGDGATIDMTATEAQRLMKLVNARENDKRENDEEGVVTKDSQPESSDNVSS